MDDRTDLRLTDEGDARLAAILRDVYAAPAGGAYWEALESRVMARIAEHRAGIVRLQASSWSVLERWAAPGLAAAALIFVAAGVFLSRENEADLRTTYEAVTETTDPDVLPGAVHVVTAPRDGSSQREATFRYVLSH